MTLVKWNPRTSLWNFDREFNSLLEDFFKPLRPVDDEESFFVPAADVEENDDSYIVTMDLPGLSKKDVHITFKEDVLYISGEKKVEKKDEKAQMHRYERSYGKFERAFRLHSEIIPDKISANFKDGVLSVTLPKAEISKPKEIEINVK